MKNGAETKRTAIQNDEIRSTSGGIGQLKTVHLSTCVLYLANALFVWRLQVPTMLRRLRDLQQQSIERSRTVPPSLKCKLDRPFANIGSDDCGKSTTHGGDDELAVKRQKTGGGGGGSTRHTASRSNAKPTTVGPCDGASSPVASSSLPKSHRLPSEHWLSSLTV